ncbi:MAG: hypothetical protein FWG32_06590 [Oscillospiraceae bacterium]|nr:hypothetical protein [Oscillospiraceae bacterium]
MISDLINWKKMRRGTLYAVYLLAALAIQNILLSNVKVYGVHPMPIPVAVVAAGLFEGGIPGGVFGLFAGMFCDAVFTESGAVFTVLFSLIGFFSGLMADYALNRRFFTYFFISLGALIITAAAQMFRFLVFTETDPAVLMNVAGIQAALSLPFVLPAYFPCKALGRSRNG